MNAGFDEGFHHFILGHGEVSFVDPTSECIYSLFVVKITIDPIEIRLNSYVR